VIYEDLIYLWLAFLLFDFIPIYPFHLPSILIIIWYIGKELCLIFSFVFLPKIFKKIFTRYPSSGERFLILLIFLIYSADLSIFHLKKFLQEFYFSSLIALFWFFHYYLFLKIFFSKLDFKYIKILFGLILPFVIIIIFEETLRIFNISFRGDLWILFFIIFVFAPVFIIKLWPVEPLKDIYYRTLILNFLKAQKIKIREIYLLSDVGKKLYTAGVIGFIPPFRYIFFSKNLLEILTPDEILGVLSHEIGHIRNKHSFWLLLLLLNFPLFILASLLLSIYAIYLIYPEFISLIHQESHISEVIFGFYLIFISLVYLRYIFAFFLRQFEREADLYSFYLLRSVRPLINALLKIGEISGQLYKKSWHHYGIFERVEFLEKISQTPEKFQKHFQKVRRMLLLWILSNVLIVAFFQYNEAIFSNVLKFLSFLL